MITVPHGRNEAGVSPNNAARVLARVEDLVSGKGVSYVHWGSAVFNKGVACTLATDYQALFDESKEWEDEHGKDLGNGWQLGHPITKLASFQVYKADQRN